MSNKVKISCVLDTTDSSCPLGMEIWMDDQQIFNQDHLTELTPFEYELSDDDGEHSLRFVMKGKTQAHTKINESGEIISDSRLVIKDIEFDEIALKYLFNNLAVYTHDFNGTGPTTLDKFHGEMGCNGTLELKFTTPTYLWLLENF
jgi:hypothetical protein